MVIYLWGMVMFHDFPMKNVKLPGINGNICFYEQWGTDSFHCQNLFSIPGVPWFGELLSKKGLKSRFRVSPQDMPKNVCCRILLRDKASITNSWHSKKHLEEWLLLFWYQKQCIKTVDSLWEISYFKGHKGHHGHHGHGQSWVPWHQLCSTQSPAVASTSPEEWIQLGDLSWRCLHYRPRNNDFSSYW